jgi:hypothetical protein
MNQWAQKIVTQIVQITLTLAMKVPVATKM